MTRDGERGGDGEGDVDCTCRCCDGVGLCSVNFIPSHAISVPTFVNSVREDVGSCAVN